MNRTDFKIKHLDRVLNWGKACPPGLRWLAKTFEPETRVEWAIDHLKSIYHSTLTEDERTDLELDGVINFYVWFVGTVSLLWDDLDGMPEDEHKVRWRLFSAQHDLRLYQSDIYLTPVDAFHNFVDETINPVMETLIVSYDLLEDWKEVPNEMGV